MGAVLIVEDDEAMSLLLSNFLESEGYETRAVDTGYEALNEIKRDRPDVVLADINLPDMSGLDLTKEITEKNKNCEVIVVTGDASAESIMTAMRFGAKDYIVKPIEKERLIITVNNSLERIKLNRKIEKLQNSEELHGFQGFIGSSKPMQELYKSIELIANSDENAFISGERGVGKALCARVIHDMSKRAERSFVAFNCATLDINAASEFEDLLNKVADGTLYLANLSQLPAPAQVILVRYIENIRRARIISSSTTRPLEDVKNGMLREDLYYMLNILPLDIVPLRERGDDIRLLAEHFLQTYSEEQDKDFGGFDTQSLNKLYDYHWPGNVKELQNFITSIITLNNSSEKITIAMFPQSFFEIIEEAENTDQNNQTASGQSALDTLFQSNEVIPIRDLEEAAIKHALDLCGGNVQEAARKLKISPATLYRKKTNL